MKRPNRKDFTATREGVDRYVTALENYSAFINKEGKWLLSEVRELKGHINTLKEKIG